MLPFVELPGAPVSVILIGGVGEALALGEGDGDGDGLGETVTLGDGEGLGEIVIVGVGLGEGVVILVKVPGALQLHNKSSGKNQEKSILNFIQCCIKNPQT